MYFSSRVPAFFVLVLVTVAAALLIAGFGVAVGVGVVVGLLLGGGVVVAVAALSQRSGATVRHGGMLISPLDSSDQPDLEAMRRHGEEATRVAGVDASALRRVIPLGEAVETGGLRVELVALEIRDDGAIATVVAHTRPPIGFVGHLLEVTVSDDAGTVYAASGQGSGSSGHGTSRHEVRFAPAPPDGVRSVTVRVEAFMDPSPGRVAPLRGPWEFRVAL